MNVIDTQPTQPVRRMKCKQNYLYISWWFKNRVSSSTIWFSLTNWCPTRSWRERPRFLSYRFISDSIRDLSTNSDGYQSEKGKWSLDGLKLEVHKQMSKLGPRKIDTLVMNIFTPSNLTTDQLNGLKKEINDCPVLRNIESSTNINLLWTQQ